MRTIYQHDLNYLTCLLSRGKLTDHNEKDLHALQEGIWVEMSFSELLDGWAHPEWLIYRNTWFAMAGNFEIDVVMFAGDTLYLLTSKIIETPLLIWNSKLSGWRMAIFFQIFSLNFSVTKIGFAMN
ncbi:hypothetical protein [Eremococcus coleocola]|uniref:hypothetical protein n=1 Tax=Eremococcus coleocola TaxID=88132 RepID=UPI000484CD8A|nr:hypothetical protein [Eremococcus coleocola]